MKNPECIIEGCLREQYYTSRGWCKKHYMRWWTRGGTDDTRAHLVSDHRPASPTDVGWAAGFLEGEGWFGHNYGPYGCQVVSACQVDKEPLSRLRGLVGGSINPRKGRPHQSDFWLWSVSGARARGLMLTIYSLMSGRRQGRIRDMLALERVGHA